MARFKAFLLPSLLLVACGEDQDDKFSKEIFDTSDPGDCAATVVEVTPTDGTTGWYYRDPLEAVFSAPAEELALVTLLDEQLEEVPLVLDWQSEGHRLSIQPESALASTTTYTLEIEVCDDHVESSFTTGPYGGDLELDPADLIGRTYLIDFDTVTVAEPEGLGLLLGMFTISPLLVAVTAADDTNISLVATEGEKLSTGGYRQRAGSDVWEFGDADFTEQPFFSADKDEVTLSYEDAAIPVSDFHMEGTFASDAESFGGGQIWGTADTRHISAGFASGDEAYICTLAEGMGVYCFECGDGEPYCLFLRIEDIEAPWQEGLELSW